MDNAILEKILAMKDASLEELQAKYAELFDGKKPASANKAYLWQRIAYRIQEVEYGSIPDEALDKLKELTQVYDPINNQALRSYTVDRRRPSRDRRLPIPGSVINKKYKGKEIIVKALEHGFEYKGKVYKTISAVAKAVSGIHWSGYSFFNLY